jgi:putative FmdB family regulatory protein
LEKEMPIYEFYCQDCNTIFNFFSKTINTTKCPSCPKCKTSELNRQISLFAVTGKAKEDNSMDDFPLDENKMEKAMQVLAKEADNINEDDPRQAARLMRKLSHMTGLELGPGMSEALDRMEKGEDPDQLESEMSDMLADEEPFILPEKKKLKQKGPRLAPQIDETLYDL